MKKIIAIAMAASLLLLGGCASLRLTPEEKAQMAAQIQENLDNRTFEIDVDHMNPRRGMSQSVTNYSIKIDGDKIVSHLPYIGAAWNLPYGGGKGLSFEAKISDYIETFDREGLLKTPERVAKSLQFLTQGYGQNGEQIIKSAIFDEKYQQMVLVKDIELYSMCEHHMLPFIGKCHVAYIPNGKITGLSKIARVVETYARRLQVQERLTVQIRDCIVDALHPLLEES